MAITPTTSTPPRESRGTPVVAVQSLTKVFKDFWLRAKAKAVDNLTFEVFPHEVFGLLGPNGSGKSTTIKIILGLLHQTSGRVAVFGKPPTDVAVKKRIGYLPEESYMYGFLNARETLDYYGKLFEIDHRTRKKRIDELLTMVGLTAAQFRPVREYSKGMQRRIGLAQALINDPDFLILDEPTTGLDPIGTRQVKDLIIELGRRGKTVLLSSHLLADVEDCVDRMVILYGGRSRAEGTCETLLESTHRTAIEADTLDDATVSEIDALIRARSAGAGSIRRVSRPRQRLEELFLGIVEKARAERLETSGAESGGATAAFLRSQTTAAEGDALIDRLTRDEPAEPPAATEELVAPDRSDGDETPDDEGSLGGVIEELLAGEEPDLDLDPVPGGTRAAPPARGAAAPPFPTATPPADDAGVDQSIIEALLDRGPRPPERRTEPRPEDQR